MSHCRTSAQGELSWLRHSPCLPKSRCPLSRCPLRRESPAFDLSQYGITVKDIRRNLSPAALYAEAIREDAKCDIADTGALIAFSGEKTGRSPKDKRVVEHPDSKSDVWWGSVNVPIDDETFEINRERAIDYLNTRKRLYVVDAFAGWDEANRAKIRVICTRPYHALFMHNMLIRPTREELQDFGEPRCRDLQRRRVSRQSPHQGDDLEDQRRSVAGTQGVRDSGHRIRRRNEEGRVHDDELLRPQARHPVDALLGDGRQEDGPLVAAVRPVGHRQDDALGRSATGCSSATTSIAGPTTASSTSKGAATPRRST